MGGSLFRALRGSLYSAALKRVSGIGAVFFGVVAIGTQVDAAEVVTHWAMPAIASPEADRPSGPSIFGTIALPIRPRTISTRWSKLMFASISQPALDRLTTGARGLPPQEQAAFVQSAIKNAVRAAATSYDCSDDGYWAPASETLARGMGDCFDIAIAKMEALRLLGIPTKDLYLTTGHFRTGYDSSKNRGSVALLVRIGEHFFLMTEHSEAIIDAGSAIGNSVQYTPIVTYGVGLTWVHGRLVKVASIGN